MKRIFAAALVLTVVSAMVSCKPSAPAEAAVTDSTTTVPVATTPDSTAAHADSTATATDTTAAATPAH